MCNTEGGGHDGQQNGADRVIRGNHGDDTGFPRLGQNAGILAGDQDNPFRIRQGQGQLGKSGFVQHQNMVLNRAGMLDGFDVPGATA